MIHDILVWYENGFAGWEVGSTERHMKQHEHSEFFMFYIVVLTNNTG